MSDTLAAASLALVSVGWLSGMVELVDLGYMAACFGLGRLWIG